MSVTSACESDVRTHCNERSIRITTNSALARLPRAIFALRQFDREKYGTFPEKHVGRTLPRDPARHDILRPPIRNLSTDGRRDYRDLERSRRAANQPPTFRRRERSFGHCVSRESIRERRVVGAVEPPTRRG